MTIVLIFAILGLSIFLYLWWKRKKKKAVKPKPEVVYRGVRTGSKTIEIRKSVLVEDLPTVIIKKDDENKSE